MKKILYVHVPCGSKTNAEKIASSAVKSKVAACAHISAVISIYEWKTRLQNTTEHLLILKTSLEKSKEITKLVKKLHEYETPCILKIKAEVNNSYYNWIKEQTNENSST